MAAQLQQIFYEVGQYYGDSVEFAIEATFNKTEGEIVQFDTESGIQIGNIPSGGLNTNINILCSNSTLP